MPQQIELSGNRSIQNMYATDGRKLKTTVKEGEELMDGTKYYNANFVFDKQKEMDYILFDEGCIVNDNGNFMYEYHVKDHLGSVRVAFEPSANGTAVVQENAYYPFGGTIDDFSYNASENRYKHTGMEAIDDFGLNMLDNNARWRDVSAVPRFYGIDPLAEMYYSISPYAYCGNNPIRYVDLRGDSLTLAGSNVQETIMAIYNGLENGTNVTMKFNNGVLDPSSIAQQAQNTSDLFLQDLFEIAVNPMMVELSTSDKNIYMLGGQKVEENFIAPYDYNTSEDPQAESLLKLWGEPIGRSIQGNLGQTLIHGNVSLSGKSSTNNNVQVIINGKGSLNHRTVGIAHEFGHVILYLRKLPYGHGQLGVDPFVYGRSTRMSKKLGYDF